MNRRFAAHLDTLFACRACPNVAGTPVTGAVWNARVMLVGQAPGPREAGEGRPFAYTAGKRLFSWFADHLGITESDFRANVHIAAVIRCFPGRDEKAGGDRVPDAEEIARCGAHLDVELKLIKPELVIAVGTLAAKQLVGESELKKVVGRVHRVKRAGHTFDVVVLPHPSGRSTWTNKPENAALMKESFRLIGERWAPMSSRAKRSGV
ncbi:MAG: uracil-DNA glycosylase family protein, partial [Thermoanaerobaculia bacterium]